VVARVVARMQHQKLAGAFMGFAEAVWGLRSARETVARVVGRMRNLLASEALSMWVLFLGRSRAVRTRMGLFVARLTCLSLWKAFSTWQAQAQVAVAERQSKLLVEAQCDREQRQQALEQVWLERIARNPKASSCSIRLRLCRLLPLLNHLASCSRSGYVTDRVARVRVGLTAWDCAGAPGERKG